MEEQGETKITPLVGSIDPAQEAKHDDHEGGDAKAINLNNDRLAPHEPVETNEHAGDEPGHHANGAFPMAGHGFEFLDPFDEQAAAAGNEHAEQAGGDGAAY